MMLSISAAKGVKRRDKVASEDASCLVSMSLQS
jgi:hypothetical protein